MKIAIFKRAIALGGGEMYTKNLVEYLDQENEVYLLSNSDLLLNSIQCKSKQIVKVRDEAIRRTQILKFIIGFLKERALYRKLCKDLKSKGIEAIILQDINEKILLTREAARQSIKVVWVEHNLLDGMLKHPLLKEMVKSQKLTSAVIVPSQILLNQCHNIFLKENFYLIRHGISDIKIKHECGKRRLIMATRLSFEKGVDLAIRALAISKNNKLQLIVYGEGSQRRSLENLCKELSVENRVIFKGHVNNPLGQTCAKDIFLIPSRSENFPLALLEAMACSMAIVAARVGGISEIIKDGVNGLIVDPEKPEQIASAIDNLMGDPKLAKNISSNARKDFINNYKKSKMLNETVKLLNCIISNEEK